MNDPIIGQGERYAIKIIAELLPEALLERQVPLSRLLKLSYIEDMGERINFLLMLEYGSIHPKLTDVKYSIIEIDKDLIIYGSESNKKASLKEIQNTLKYHYDDSNNRWLKNINNIKGIVVPDGDRWRLIDGYHRCLSTSRKMIKVIVGNK